MAPRMDSKMIFFKKRLDGMLKVWMAYMKFSFLYAYEWCGGIVGSGA